MVYHLGGGTLEYENPRKVFLNFRNSLYSLLKNKPFRNCSGSFRRGCCSTDLPARVSRRKGSSGPFGPSCGRISLFTGTSESVRKRKETMQLIARQKFRLARNEGVYPGSIIVAHYLRRVKEFSKLFRD